MRDRSKKERKEREIEGERKAVLKKSWSRKIWQRMIDTNGERER